MGLSKKSQSDVLWTQRLRFRWPNIEDTLGYPAATRVTWTRAIENRLSPTTGYQDISCTQEAQLRSNEDRMDQVPID
jgi:hypothetical protein